ncbi:transcriptional regulator with XRE-family HTH domain [Thermocatellispora tengchongensis]|uniref:Transcriptional regulator with XRE-family HTH domain n=1 Tax=Thermocatellispora tengchongensis TaxID=1073253 RepID=A0A840P3T4_9ACTN|nr:helix-turn-helix transcriptional regulator [Thermocatellispora tengchongensis]MBB5134338.1 transcriptional regulator with XRE-family HTH domain [Thermocatellispora tengchongensis]
MRGTAERDEREAPIGELLRSWRQRRRVSQLDLAIAAGVSARHISFLETGRARPSREMVMRLADNLGVPLRHRNRLLVAAGFAPAYRERPVDAPEMGAVRAALDKILAGHEPYPALVVDRGWHLVAANRAAGLFLEGMPDHLLEPPINVMRLSLHPDGLAARMVNLPEVRASLLYNLRRQADASGDGVLAELHDEIAAYRYPGVDVNVARLPGAADILVPLRVRHGDAVLSLFTTIAAFGTPVDVTVSELAIEMFWPNDEATAAALRAWAGE